MLWVQLIVVAVLGYVAHGKEPSEVFAVIYEWSKLDFTWPDDTIKARFLDSSQYIQENTTISGVKVWRDKLFLTLPRWRKGVPATLASIPHPNSRKSHEASPKLEPFPSWDMQQLGNCSALQNVQNIEIHPDGYMWVIDSGRVNTMSEQSDDKCPPKLVIFDLNSLPSSSGYSSYNVDHGHSTPREYNPQAGYNDEGSYGSQTGYQDGYSSPNENQGGYNTRDEYQGYNSQGSTPGGYYPSSSSYNTQNGGTNGYNSQSDYSNSYSVHPSNSGIKIMRTFVFSDPVVSLDSYLVDIVLDTVGGGYAYISDGSETDPGIIVYSWKDNRAWKVRDNRSMRADPGLRSLTINGMYVTISKNIAGLALSPITTSEENRKVFYSPLSSYSLFSIPTSILKDESRSSGDVSGHVNALGSKTSISEGMAMDSNGVMYYGLLGENAITKWNTNVPFANNQHMIARDSTLLQWPAGFGFDSEMGNLTVVSNRLQNFLAGRVNLNEANFRIITAYTGAKSYLYPSSGMTYTTSIQVSTEMSDESYNADRNYGYNDHRDDRTQDHQVASNNIQGGNDAERMLPGMTIILLAVVKFILA